MLGVRSAGKRTRAYLWLPGSITRTQCTGTVPKTSGEGDLWLGMEGECRSLFNVDLEQADDKESLEALCKDETVQVSQVFPSLRNAHKVANVVHTRRKQRVEHGCQKLRVCTETRFLSVLPHEIH